MNGCTFSNSGDNRRVADVGVSLAALDATVGRSVRQACCDIDLNPRMNRITNPYIDAYAGCPSPGLAAYGGLYNNTGAPLPALVAGLPAQLPLPTAMPGRNVTYALANSIYLFEGGTYEVAVSMAATADVAATFAIAARVDGITQPALTFTRILTAAGDIMLGGSAIITAHPNAVLDLAAMADVTAVVTLNAGNGASLTVRKLSATTGV